MQTDVQPDADTAASAFIAEIRRGLVEGLAEFLHDHGVLQTFT